MTDRISPPAPAAADTPAAADPPAAPAFAPVPQRSPRHDGWTPKRQRDFIEALADSGSVTSACRAVGLTTNGAYRLRRKPGAETFSAAWDAALDAGVRRMEDVAMDRALNGVEHPVWHYGKRVGTRTSHNDRLLMFVLRNRAAERFGGSTGANGNLNAGRVNALKREWEAEKKAEFVASLPGIRRGLEAKLSLLAERLAAPLPPGLAAHEQAAADRTIEGWSEEGLSEDGGGADGTTPDAHDRPGPRVRGF